MIKRYPIYNSIVPSGERRISHVVTKVHDLSLSDKIKLDIELHDMTVESTNRKKIKQHYEAASNDKRFILEIIEGRNKEVNDIDKALALLEQGKGSHSLEYKRNYSRSWDIAWLKVYDSWITEVQRIKSTII